MDRTIIVIVEHFGGKIRPISYELAAFASGLKQLDPIPVQAVIVGAAIEEPAQAFAGQTGLDVIAVNEASFASYNGEVHKRVLGELLPELNAAYVCVANTAAGLQYAPALALKLKAACITGVEKVFGENGQIYFTRALFNGKILSEIHPEKERVVLTLSPGLFKPPDCPPEQSGSVMVRSAATAPSRCRSLGLRASGAAESTLSEAQVVVSAGRGIREKKNLDLIFKLASCFAKSAVAGSRGVCDAGWLDHKHQVGLTGATVKPKLYIACGISGAAQHLSGMREADFIVAINTDPRAAIFNIADVCIGEDLTVFIPAFIEAYQKTRLK